MDEKMTKDAIDRFYQSVIQKNDDWQNLWAEDAVFGDPSGTLHAEGMPAVIQSFTPFLKGVANLKVLQQIIQGADACCVVRYNYVNPKGETMQQDDAEVWQVRDGKLSRLTIYFDLTEYRSFMRR